MSAESSTPSEPDAMVMVYDDRGNAFDAFPYTPEELELRAQLLRGWVTIKPSPFVLSTSAEIDE